MNREKDGGPAFPRHYGTMTTSEKGRANKEQLWAPGMSLRDWFAGMAIQGLMASYERGTWESFSVRAYKIADAMIEERRIK